jgi:hypothetical protein
VSNVLNEEKKQQVIANAEPIYWKYSDPTRRIPLTVSLRESTSGRKRSVPGDSPKAAYLDAEPGTGPAATHREVVGRKFRIDPEGFRLIMI